jgi:hypothetical protein
MMQPSDHFIQWLAEEPLPPQALVPKPERRTPRETLAIFGKGLSPERRLQIESTPVVLCEAPGLRERHVLQHLNHTNALQVACWAPRGRISIETRLTVTCYSPVLAAFWPGTWRKVPPVLYTALYARGMPKKERMAWALRAAEKDRLFFAILRERLHKEDRIFLVKDLSKDARDYFEYRTGMKPRRLYNFEKRAEL